jgi:hypothetical protein
MSDGIKIVPGTAPANPTIYSFAPTQGGIGTQITVAGASFNPSQYAPQDLLVLGRGVHGFLGRATQLTQTGLRMVTTYRTPFSKPTAITVIPGRTTSVVLPTMPGRPPFPLAKTFRGDGSPRFTSTQTFDPRSSTDAPCGGPPTKVTLHPRVDLNKVYIDFPATLCIGDKWKYELLVSDVDAGDEPFKFSFDSRDTSGGWTAGLPASGPLGKMILDFQLTGHVNQVSESQSDATPVFVATPTSTGVCIELNPNNPNRVNHNIAIDLAGFYELEFGPGTTTSMIIKGVEDGFNPANGPELTNPDPALLAVLQQAGSGQSQRQYDQNIYDAYLVDKVNLPGTGAIRGMAVEVRLRAAGSSLTINDSMSLDWTGTATQYPIMAWGMSMQRLSYLGFIWTVGDDFTFCWDLAELPLINASNVTTGYRDILSSGNDGDLDLYVQDDTDVDYIKVWIVRC